MDFATAVATGNSPSPAPAAPQVSTAANAAPPAPASPMDKIAQLFPPAQAPAATPANQPAAAQPSPAAPVQAQPPTPQATPQGTPPDQAAQYQQQLIQENARLREQAAQGQQAAMQAALEKTTAALEKITQIQQNPVLTPEQQKAAIDAEFAELNGGSPKATIRKWVGGEVEALKKTVEELQTKLNTLEPAVQKVDRFSTRDENLERLYKQGHTELADQAFRQSLFHPDNVAYVQEKFYGAETDALKVYKDPGFYNLLLQNAKLRAAQGFQPAQAQSQADMAAQAQIAQAGGGFVPNGKPAGANNGTPPLTQDQQLKQQLLGTRRSFGDLVANTQFGNR